MTYLSPAEKAAGDMVIVLDLYLKKENMLVFFIFTSSSYFGAVLEKAQSVEDLVLDKHLFYFVLQHLSLT